MDRRSREVDGLFLESAPAELGFSILFVGASFSIARFLSQWVAKLGDRGSAVWFLLLVFIQLALCIFWPSFMGQFRARYIIDFQRHLSPVPFQSIWPGDTFDPLPKTFNAMLKDGFVHYYVSYFNLSHVTSQAAQGVRILNFARP